MLNRNRGLHIPRTELRLEFVTSSHAPERAGLPASQSTFGFSTGLNSTQSAPTTLLPNPSSTLQGTWYRQLTCIPDQASLKVNGCTEIAASIDIVDLCGVKVMKGVRFIPSPEGDGFSLPLYPDVINRSPNEHVRRLKLIKANQYNYQEHSRLVRW
jgi:hypothetical protein